MNFKRKILGLYLRLKQYNKIKLYFDFDDVQKKCRHGGYSNEEIAKIVIKKNLVYKTKKANKEFTLSEINTIVPFIFIKKNNLNILDWGGGGGNLYTIAKTILGASIKKWSIIETSSIASRSGPLEDGCVNFYTSINDARIHSHVNFDLVIASSSIQYHPAPLEILEELLSLRSIYVYIMSTTLATGSNNAVINQYSLLSHNGPGDLPNGYEDRITTYPMFIIDTCQFEDLINKNYEIVFKIKESKFYCKSDLNDISFWSYLIKLK
jgi:putative methyltransferase (TIGR04325 family)